MGALIISRYDRHPIGWLLGLVGLAGAFSHAHGGLRVLGPGVGRPRRGRPRRGQRPGSPHWPVVSSAIAGLALMFLLAPDGHFYSRRWRYVGLADRIGEALCFLAVLSMDPTTFELVTQSDEIGIVRGVMLTDGIRPDQRRPGRVGRLRAGTTAEQRGRAASAAPADRALGGTDRARHRLAVRGPVFIGDAQAWLASTPLFVSYFLMPILFATAVLRYRLYDLDLIINRTRRRGRR